MGSGAQLGLLPPYYISFFKLGNAWVGHKTSMVKKSYGTMCIMRRERRQWIDLRWLCLAGIALVLVGCAPVDALGPGGGDLNEQVAIGQARQTSTARAEYEGRIRSTEQALRERQKTANEIAVIMAPVTAEAARLELQSTENAERRLDEDRAATRTAVAVTAEYNAGRATEEAVVRMREANRAVYWGWFMAVWILGTTAGAAYVAYLLIRRWEEAKIDLEQQKIDLERQRFALREIGGSMWWVNAQGRPILLTGEQTGNVVVKAKTVKAKSGNEHNTQALAVQLIGRGIELYGEHSIEIPSRIEMNWSPGKWMRVTRPLKELGIIDTIEGQETFLAEGGPYVNLQQLYWDLVDEKLLLRPSPTGAWSVAGD